MAKKSSKSNKDDEGGGPRFQSGEEDLDQLEGIEQQQQRSRKASRKTRKKNGDVQDTEECPLIDSINKSKKRLKNRLKNINSFGEAHEEFGD